MARLGLGIGIGMRPASGLFPPAGFLFLVDSDGAYLTDADGAYLIEAV